MRAFSFIITCLICFLTAHSATALEPLDEFAMDNVRARSGIAIGLDNIQIYSHTGWAYEATSYAAGSENVNRKISFEDTSSYLILNTRNPLTFRVMQSPESGVAMLELTGQPSVWMDMNVNEFSFAGHDMGSLHLSLRPPDGDLMGFMEEFLLYVAPLGTQAGFASDGIAFQFETRSGIEEFRWDYNVEEDTFHFGGVYMAGAFDPYDPLVPNPADWNPTGRFTIGDLDIYDNTSPLGPATFHVLPDEDDLLGEGYALLRLNIPMEGSARINEIGMYIIDDQGPQPPPNWPDEPAVDPIEFVSDDFGPMIIDGMTFHHLQVDFKTYEP